MERSLPAPNHFNIDPAALYHCLFRMETLAVTNAFEIYAIATELKKKEDSIQRATLLHCLGPAVQRISVSTLLCGNANFDDAKQSLENYFAPKRNVSER